MAGRPKLWPDKMTAPLPEGSFARMDAVRGENEDRTDFVRGAVEAELARREQRPGTPPQNPRRPAKGRSPK